MNKEKLMELAIPLSKIERETMEHRIKYAQVCKLSTTIACNVVRYAREQDKSAEEMAKLLKISLDEYLHFTSGMHNFNLEEICLLENTLKVHLIDVFYDR